MSAQILNRYNEYYQILEHNQKGDGNITAWLVWFVNILESALLEAHSTIDKILAKATFWQTHRHQALNERQVKMLNQLLTSFYGKLTTKKWSVMMKCSVDTALRDINDLVAKDMLRRSDPSGRSTSYEMVLQSDE